MNVQILEKCPSCGGSGEIRASILIIDEIENNLSYLVREQNEKDLTLIVHPYTHAFLTKGIFCIRWKWQRKYHVKLKITSQNSYHFLEYHFYNKHGDEIKM